MACVAGVCLSVGILFVLQLRSIVRNRTQIEDWILEKAEARPRDTPFVFPYHFGWRGNLQDFYASCTAGDGVTWKVRHGMSLSPALQPSAQL